ncbi:MAG: PfkB family carbohydrate kinase, partial [Gaiellales bacterium]
TNDGRSGTYDRAASPGPVVDTYGAGDSFAAGLTVALGAGM